MDECLGFVVEWFDPNAQINRLYLLKYFTHNNTVESKERKPAARNGGHSCCGGGAAVRQEPQNRTVESKTKRRLW